MSELLLLILYCALLGSGVGFLAGLLGIGGGLIIVPVLSSILLHLEILPADQVVVADIATSLASILFTSTSSALAHHKNGNVPWDMAPWIMLGVALGALVSGFVARKSCSYCVCSECGSYRNKDVLKQQKRRA